jgi:catechol 2,3-dioxygenase-like lactoylglutathione lyase family enzyme
VTAAAPALAAVVAVSQDPEAARALLAGALGLPRATIGFAGARIEVLLVGQAALAIVPPGHDLADGAPRPGVRAIALAVPDPPAAAAGLPHGPLREWLGASAAVALDPAATAGVRTVLTTPLGLAPAGGPLVERFDHIGIASADNAAGIAAFHDRLGLPLESRQTDMEVSIAVESFTSDKYGVVYHTRPPVPAGGLRVAFLTAGDCDLELLQNFDPAQGGEVRHDTPGNTRQDQGAIARYVGRHGPGLHHLAFKTPDIAAALAAMRGAGARMIDTAGRPGSRRALIGFVHPAALGGILVHFVERTPL